MIARVVTNPDLVPPAPAPAPAPAPEAAHHERATLREDGTYELAPNGIDLAAVERSFVEQALDRANGNQTRAAKLLAISRFALRHRIDRYGLQERLK